MDLIIFLAVGAFSGWLAGVLFKGGGFGILWNIIIGIVGGVLGGWLFGGFVVSIFGTGITGGIVTAVLGALLLLWIANKIGGK